MESSDAEAVWFELRVLVPLSSGAADDEATAEAELASLEALCLTISPGGLTTEGPDAPPGDLAPPAHAERRLRLYVLDDALEVAQARLAAGLAAHPGATLEVVVLSNDWQERWKDWFHGFEVSPRLAVRPPWEEPPPSDTADPAAGRRTIVIEPGMAFGTGQHETTRLCLRLVDRLYSAGDGPARVLDVGCGTGILAIAAALLGASEALGVDVDRHAVGLARENAAANGVSDIARFEAWPLADLVDLIDQIDGTTGPPFSAYPLVLANILPHVLLALADELVAATAEGGLLVLSGVLAEQAEEVSAAFEALGMRRLATVDDGGWVRLELRR